LLDTADETTKVGSDTFWLEVRTLLLLPWILQRRSKVSLAYPIKQTK
jgi:hypothetical protein